MIKALELCPCHLPARLWVTRVLLEWPISRRTIRPATRKRHSHLGGQAGHQINCWGSLQTNTSSLPLPRGSTSDKQTTNQLSLPREDPQLITTSHLRIPCNSSIWLIKIQFVKLEDRHTSPKESMIQLWSCHKKDSWDLHLLKRRWTIGLKISHVTRSHRAMRNRQNSKSKRATNTL